MLQLPDDSGHINDQHFVRSLNEQYVNSKHNISLMLLMMSKVWWSVPCNCPSRVLSGPVWCLQLGLHSQSLPPGPWCHWRQWDKMSLGFLFLFWFYEFHTVTQNMIKCVFLVTVMWRPQIWVLVVFLWSVWDKVSFYADDTVSYAPVHHRPVLNADCLWLALSCTSKNYKMQKVWNDTKPMWVRFGKWLVTFGF